MNNDTPADAMQLKPCPFCGEELSNRPAGPFNVLGMAIIEEGPMHYNPKCILNGLGTSDTWIMLNRHKWNTRTTSLAAQDGLVEALELVQKLIADAFEQIAPLKRQGEDRIWQPASTACVMLWEARDRIAALASIEVKSS